MECFYHQQNQRCSVMMTTLQLVVHLLALCMVVVGDTNFTGDTFTNMEVYDGKVYVGAKNWIFVLNSADLVKIEEVDTCNGTGNCNNVNKVLLVNKGASQLITCGTGHGGICEIRKLTDVREIQGKSSNNTLSPSDTSDSSVAESKSENYLVVSKSEHRPACFILMTDTGYLFTGITYGIGVSEFPKGHKKSYRYFLRYYKLKDHQFGAQKSLILSLPDSLEPVDVETYVVYFRAGFEYNGFAYFLTNQKSKVVNGTYISKIIRVCQNDTDFHSYTDIEIRCSADDVDYKLVQDISLFQPEELNDTIGEQKKILAATFAYGSDPERPGNKSAICLYNIDDIDKHIMMAKELFITCPLDDGLSAGEEYLSNERGDFCVNTSTNHFNGNLFMCGAAPRFSYIIGGVNSALTATPVYTVSAKDHGHLNKIKCISTGRFTVLYVGTSEGIFYKLNLNSGKAEVYETRPIDKGYPITGIHVEADGKIEYVMSTNKIVREELTDCSKYESCEAVMDAKNPLCGWCVYEMKSTFKEDNVCPYQNYSGRWLSSLTQCLTLIVQPRGVSIGKAVNVNISIEPYLPFDNATSLGYRCKFKGGKTNQETTWRKNRTCRVPTFWEHTESVVQFYVIHGSERILLAETDFLFYDCAYYNSCNACTGDKRTECSWDPYNTVCESRGSAGSLAIDRTDECAGFEDDAEHYLPSGVTKELTFNVTNLVNSTEIKYWCKLEGKEKVAAEKDGDHQIKCNLTETIGNKKTVDYIVEILYGNSFLEGSNTVVVYNCTKLGQGCSHCRSLKYSNSTYKCDWCENSCTYAEESCDGACERPSITRVLPDTAAMNGSILVTITGRELGSRFEDVQNITLAGVDCQPEEDGFTPSLQVTCTAGMSTGNASGPVIVTVNNKNSTEDIAFSYKLPVIRDIIPVKGPKKGGTRLTIEGDDLGVGTRKVTVYLHNRDKKYDCSDASVYPYVALAANTSGINFKIVCVTPPGVMKLTELDVVFDSATVIKNSTDFTYLENPVIEGMVPMKGIASGGNLVTITGKNFTNAHQGYITGNGKEQLCNVISPQEMICAVPALTKKLKNKFNSQNSRRKRDTDSTEKISVQIIIHLDGVEKPFTIWYYSDPVFSDFDDENQVKLFQSDQQKLTIKGKNLNLVAEKEDVNITIGIANCQVIELKEDSLTCVVPKDQPAAGISGAELPEVNVSIGNVKSTVGYLKYIQVHNEEAQKWTIIAAVIGGLLAIVVLVAVGLLLKYKQKSKKMRKYQGHVEEQEIEIKQIFREEFADMHTSMLATKNNLIEQGCPYHHYQQYAFKIMFPVDTLENHPLLQEPVVSNKVTDEMRSKMRRGMEEFESLIFNKYFLLSVIDSLESQRKFGLKDKANMCGYICSILLGRMEYLQEILEALLGNLVQESVGKKTQKVLFRRSETITEKLLSNWLSLCLYPHLKSQSGCPLYLLYKATQLHMEAGPIDAITNDAKYTLSEEKLLKKYQHSKQGTNEPTFEAKCLTLNVVVDNCRDVKICRVLDCDTITQVKEKCLTQIYVNYPASNLTVSPEELELEWHAGMSGSLRLRDEDNTSKRDGDWMRLNTLAHYNVQDDSNMALIDPQVADDSEEIDYVNLAQVQMTCSNDNSIDSTDAATAALVDVKNRHVRYWHMVKPEGGTLTPGKSTIAELYLNRLLTFKQSILDYVHAMYDTVLKEDILPPHVEYFYKLLDELAEKHKVEGDTLHTWKSMSYLVRIWANLIKIPSIVFDIKSPPYVDTSMDVVSQVFIECCSLEAHKLTKDSPSHKLIFNNDLNHYKERTKLFYKQVGARELQQDSLRNYLEDVNKLQQQHVNINKMSALYKLYQQMEPYITEIIDDLSTNREACRLHLDKKLEQINGLMSDD